MSTNGRLTLLENLIHIYKLFFFGVMSVYIKVNHKNVSVKNGQEEETSTKTLQIHKNDLGPTVSTTTTIFRARHLLIIYKLSPWKKIWRWFPYIWDKIKRNEYIERRVKEEEPFLTLYEVKKQELDIRTHMCVYVCV